MESQLGAKIRAENVACAIMEDLALAVVNISGIFEKENIKGFSSFQLSEK